MGKADRAQAGSTTVFGGIVLRELTLGDLSSSLSAGWADFRAKPAFGLFFGAFYAAVGLLFYYALFLRGEMGWLVPAMTGGPLLAPFAAVGLYEVSRRREAGLPIGWRNVLGAMRGRGDDQIMSMGLIVFIAFSFWVVIAHGIFAIFMAESGMGKASIDIFLTGPGIAMLIVGSAAGALLALAFYSITVVSLPMLIDREVDFITAIIASLACVRANPRVMIAWAVIVATSLFIAMLLAFLGLLVVLPVLGHATWHLYRRAVQPAGEVSGESI